MRDLARWRERRPHSRRAAQIAPIEDNFAVEELREIVAAIRQTGDRHSLARILLDFSFVQRDFSYYRDAYQGAVESLATLIEGHEENPYLSFEFQRDLVVAVTSLRLLGEWGAVLRELAATATAAERNGDHTGAWVVSLSRAHLHLDVMDFEGALAICESASRIKELTDFPPARRFCLIAGGIAEIGLGDFARARQNLTTALQDMERVPALTDRTQRFVLQRGLTDVCLATGDLARARVEAESFLETTLGTEERTWRALAWEANARLAVAEGDPIRAEECIARALVTTDGYEVPLAAWQVRATAADRYARAGNRAASREHGALSRATVLSLASSLREDEPLRSKFLSAPLFARIVAGAD